MYAVTFVPWRDPYIRTSTHTLETKLAKCLVCCCKVQSVCLARRPIRKRESIFLVKIEKRNFALSISSLGLSWRWCDVDECWERMDVQRRKRIKQYTKNVFSRPTLSFIFFCLPFVILFLFQWNEIDSRQDRVSEKKNAMSSSKSCRLSSYRLSRLKVSSRNILMGFIFKGGGRWYDTYTLCV